MVHEHEHEQKVHEQFDMAIWLYAKSHNVTLSRCRRVVANGNGGEDAEESSQMQKLLGRGSY